MKVTFPQTPNCYKVGLLSQLRLCPLKLVVSQTECKCKKQCGNWKRLLFLIIAVINGLFSRKWASQITIYFKQCGPVHLVSQGEDNFTLMGVRKTIRVGLHKNPHDESDPNKKRVGRIS